MSGPVVWRAAFDEAEAVAGLLVRFRDWWGASWPSDNAMLATVERLMDDPRGTAFLLAAPDPDAPPAGVCQLRFRLSVWQAADDCTLEDLYVADEARGRGLGRALLEAALGQARERGCRRIELDVNERNETGVRLYESVGFTAQVASLGGRNLLMRLPLTTAGP